MAENEQPEKTNTTTSAASTGESIWVKITVGWATAFVGAVLGATATYLIQNHANRVQVLHYIVTPTPKIISRPDLPEKNVRISVNGKEVESLSSVGVAVVNDSGQDYENVPLKVLFTDRLGNEIKPILRTIRTSPDEYAEIPTTTRPSRGERYELKIVNRSSPTVFNTEYFFEGSEVPTSIEVSVAKKGLSVERQAITHDSHIDTTYVVTIMIATIVGYFWAHIMNWFSRKYERPESRDRMLAFGGRKATETPERKTSKVIDSSKTIQ